MIFAVGIGLGAVGSRLGSDSRNADGDDAIVVGCGADVTLIVDADDLGPGLHELRASVGDRMLPMINSMTYPLVGKHRGHQWLVPDGGRLLIVANVPVGKGNTLRYELVGDGSEPAASGVLPSTCSPAG